MAIKVNLLEEQLHGQVSLEFVADLESQTSGEQRVTTQLEEALVGVSDFHAQDFGPQLDQGLFLLGQRSQ